MTAPTKPKRKPVIISNDTLEAVAKVMGQRHPPSQEWWQKNYVLLDGAHFPGVMVDPVVDCFNLDTKFSSHWDLLRATFRFIQEYKSSKYASRERSEEYMEAIRAFLLRIRAVCDEEPGENYRDVLCEIGRELKFLIDFAKHRLGKKEVDREGNFARRILQTLSI
jgi:hypothetical protein